VKPEHLIWSQIAVLSYYFHFKKFSNYYFIGHVKKNICWLDRIKGSNKGREVEVLPSERRNLAFWSDHGKAFVVTCSWNKGKNI
jgi:hypothetical protein